jgi:hypothetical protein
MLFTLQLSYKGRFGVENTIITKSDVQSVEKVVMVSYLIISNKFRAL